MTEPADPADRKPSHQPAPPPGEPFLSGPAGADRLAGLPGRDAAALALRIAATCGQTALLLLNLDRFRRLNDSLGEHGGDALLAAVAARLAGCIRHADTLARTGGDEFTIIAPCSGQASADGAALAERIMAGLAAPFEVAGRTVSVTLTIGLACLPEDAATADALQRCAQLALFAGKQAGRARLSRFDPAAAQAMRQAWETETRLRAAVAEHAITVRYQPIHHIPSGRIAGVEALARWDHPTRGAIPPDEFIPLTEKHDLIRQLGAQILRQACLDAQPWIARGDLDFVSVNLSPIQVQHGAVVQDVLRVIEETGTDARHLVLEVTESLALADSPSVRASLDAFRGAGIRLALDDFGAGFSNLAYLNRLPIERLKIDRLLATDIAEGGFARTILQSLIDLAHRLELQVIVEGVETDAQMGVLRALGADYAQGFLFSRPMTAAALTKLLAAARADKAPS